MKEKEESRIFKPHEITFDNFDIVVSHGKSEIEQEGELTVDFGDVKHCNSLAICVLLALLRLCIEQGCKFKLLKTNLHLEKFIRLYQMEQVLSFDNYLEFNNLPSVD